MTEIPEDVMQAAREAAASIGKAESRFREAVRRGEHDTLFPLPQIARAILDEREKNFDFITPLKRQAAWSTRTFGPGARTSGVIDHIRKELIEIEARPDDIMEWVDVIILAFDGAWRAGWAAEDIVSAIIAKQTTNEGRTWPDWRTAASDKAIEHIRGGAAP